MVLNFSDPCNIDQLKFGLCHFCFLTTLKPLTVQVTINYGKFLKRWEYQTTIPASWETCIQVKKQQLGQNMKLQTGLKLRKAVYFHPTYLTYI